MSDEWKESAAALAEGLSEEVATLAQRLLQETIMPAANFGIINPAANSLARSKEHLDKLVRQLRGQPEPEKKKRGAKEETAEPAASEEATP